FSRMILITSSLVTTSNVHSSHNILANSFRNLLFLTKPVVCHKGLTHFGDGLSPELRNQDANLSPNSASNFAPCLPRRPSLKELISRSRPAVPISFNTNKSGTTL